MLFVYDPDCGTCRKIKTWLDSRGLEYESRDIKLHKPTAAELLAWSELGRLHIRSFWNREKLSFKHIRLMNSTVAAPAETYALIMAGGEELLCHPILVGDNFVVAGPKKSDWEKALNIKS